MEVDENVNSLDLTMLVWDINSSQNLIIVF